MKTNTEIERELALARSSLRREVPIWSGNKIAWGLNVSHEALQWRLVSLASTCVSVLDRQEPLAAGILARSAIETCALIDRLHSIVGEYLVSRDRASAEAAVKRVWLAHKAGDDPDSSPINVMTCIQKMAKKFTPAIADEYNDLSEIAHPNYFGTHGYFGRADDGVYRFDSVERDETGYFDGIARSALWGALAFGNYLRDDLPALVGRVKMAESQDQHSDERKAP